MGKLVHDTNHTGQIGISWLRWIIEGQWGCGIEVISAHNDNSMDILIFPKRKIKKTYRGPTGDVVFAQVKAGYKKNEPTTSYSIHLGKTHIAEHRSRWLSFPGPVLMINVLPPKITGGNPKAYWADLRSPDSFKGSGSVFFNINHQLERTSGKSNIFNLCWRWAEFRDLPRLEAPRSIRWSNSLPVQRFSVGHSIHERSRAFYADWMKAARQDPDAFGGVKVTNRGWRHMTRMGRSKSRMLQSLLLLPSASQILEQPRTPAKRLTQPEEIVLPSGNKRIRFYEGITARITFFERQEAIVRVVLERNIVRSATDKPISDDSTLYSVYEVARGQASA